ncbi:hypothetical protein [Thermasporomyces composti]|jgi:hypothetical protein|uniref:Uncharacterized protein n=1 Tax=Thermasporomyces composti TaxID=696763 RepID=A0A3D9V7P6_THECX|nr:hypothetical protein [Thermasporomyces composti]REF37818.1 hypothetical protein DFJ64_3276 [Thermasporomyces composti]
MSERASQILKVAVSAATTLIVGVAAACGGSKLSADIAAPIELPRATPLPKEPPPPPLSPVRTVTPEPSASATTTTPRPAASLSPLPQPSETYPTPKMPKGPDKADPELSHIKYKLRTIVWNSAGVVDPKTTKVTCDVDEDDIIKIGTYDFSCRVTLWGSTTKFKVKAKVDESEVTWSWTATALPVSEQKAVYEATRQGWKPARVTCDIVGMKLVTVGVRDGFTCWVTNVLNESIPYRGELLPNGALAFRSDSGS